MHAYQVTVTHPGNHSGQRLRTRFISLQHSGFNAVAYALSLYPAASGISAKPLKTHRA